MRQQIEFQLFNNDLTPGNFAQDSDHDGHLGSLVSVLWDFNKPRPKLLIILHQLDLIFGLPSRLSSSTDLYFHATFVNHLKFLFIYIYILSFWSITKAQRQK